VSRLGHGKRTPVDDYPKHGRGGQGVITFKTHEKSGDLVTARMVDPEHELIMVSEGGIILRTPVKHISQQGRPTQGVKLMNVGDDDRVAAVAVIDMRKEYDSQPLPTGASHTDGDGIEVKKKGSRGVAPGTNGTSNGRKSK
jgi:DNA gyrase subunit A